MKLALFILRFSTCSASCKKLVIIGMVFLFYACGTKKQNQMATPAGMSVIELNNYGKPFSIFVPDTSNHPLSIIEESSGALLVKAGSTFAISIYEEAADLELKRQDIASDEVNKFKTFIIDEPTGILWESAITESEFHFLVNTTVAGRVFGFQDVQNTESKNLVKAAVVNMFNSCKNIQESQK